MAYSIKTVQEPVCNGQHKSFQRNEEQINQIFDEYCSANTFKAILKYFDELCQATGISQDKNHLVYNLLKLNIKSWKAQNIWSKLDKKMSGWEYGDRKACTGTKVLVIGCGPCGLRVAIEAALLGCSVVVLEKRDGFTRNNVLHLWPFLIHDLKSLGAKHFFGKFCSGSIDHISIRTLQCILLKVALLLDVKVYAGVEFLSLKEPEISSEGWTSRLQPVDHEASLISFDVCISADGKRNTMPDFKRKEFRGKLAIAITANFINHKTKEEASVEEISGVSYIFNQKFFKDLSQDTGIDLENIVYYKDETHYFVMTAKKQNLLIKKVLLQDFDDPEMLLASENVDQQALMQYATEAAEFSTNHKLPNLEFAHNQYGQPDVSMFDFTSMFAAENACRVVERNNHKLLLGLVGDTLLEPFWPTGSGCARGFLSALDAAWMIRSWSSQSMGVLEVIAERESIYQLLSQTTPENLNKNYSSFSIDPITRYVNLNLQSIHPQQVRYLFDGTDVGNTKGLVKTNNSNKFKQYDMCEKYRLLRWCQMQLESYENLVRVVDMYNSWKNGIALSALIHRYRPELIDVYSLDNRMALENLKTAINILENDFGIVAEFNAEDLLTTGIQVENLLTSYLLQFRDVVSEKFGYSAKPIVKDTPSVNSKTMLPEEISAVKENNSDVIPLKSGLSTLTDSTVSAIAQNFSIKPCEKSLEGGSSSSSNTCYICGCRVYLVQRLIAEDLVFHRNCFRCCYCLACLHKDYYSYCKEENQFFCKHHFGLRRSSPVSTISKDPSKSRHKPLKKLKIPERAEYTTESEIGENEDDQARHNLISLSSPSKIELDLSTSEEELQFLVDEASDEEPDFAWAHVAKLCSIQNDEKVQIDSVRFTKGSLDMFKDKAKTTSIISLESTSEAETVGGSDADWETDTEMEESAIDESNIESKIEIAEDKKQEIIRPTRSAAISNNKMAFFSTPAQPVRIDARAFLGLDVQVNGQEEKALQSVEVEQQKLAESALVEPSSIVLEINGSKSKNRSRPKKRPKKFTKKRKKEEKLKKKNGILPRKTSDETKCEQNDLLSRNISSSPSSPAISKDTANVHNDSIKKVVSMDMTEIIEKMLHQFVHHPTSIVNLSSDSGSSEEDLSVVVPSVVENSPVVKKSEVAKPSEEEVACMIATNLVEDALIDVQQTLAKGSLKSDEGVSSTPSDPDPATVLDPSHGTIVHSSSSASIIEIDNNEACQPINTRHDCGDVINEDRKLSQRSTSYDSCLKLAAAINNLLVDNSPEPNASTVINIDVEHNSDFQWQEMESSGTTSTDVKLIGNESIEKPTSKDSLSMSSIASSKSIVSPNKFIDAKRRFFYEAPQPVRIDHRAFFGELAQSEKIPRDVMARSSNGLEIVKNEHQDSNIKVAECSSLTIPKKHETPAGISEHNKNARDVTKLEFSPFDSSEEIKHYTDVLSVSREASNAERKDNYFSDPETSYKIGRHNINSKSAEIRKKVEKTVEGKEKRRSFLSKIIQLKLEKKDKKSNVPSLPGKSTIDQHDATSNKDKTNSLPLEKRKHGRRKVLEKSLAPKSKSQSSKCEGIGQSVYEEMAPIMEGIKKVQQRNKEKNNIKERVQVIAPPMAKTPVVNLVPPKADLDDFETESEIGDERLSLWSLHSQNEKMMNISEEETSRQRKKQLKLVRRKHKEKELSRMHSLQEIIGKLEEIEIQQQQVEERGVQIERILRGEKSEQEKLLDEVFLIQEWFNAIQEMNFLNRHESELIVQTRELELEDKQHQLQLQLQETMLQDDNADKLKEQEILLELVDVVEKRDKLVLLLEEERLKHKQYDHNLQKIMEERGFILSTSENNLS